MRGPESHRMPQPEPTPRPEEPEVSFDVPEEPPEDRERADRMNETVGILNDFMAKHGKALAEGTEIDQLGLSEQEKEAFLTSFRALAEYAAQEPEEAMRVAETITFADARGEFLRIAAKKIGETDPERALAMFERGARDAGLDDEAIERVLADMRRENVEARESETRMHINEIVDDDPAAAARLFLESPRTSDQFRWREVEQQINAAVRKGYKDAAERGLNEGVAFYRALPDGTPGARETAWDIYTKAYEESTQELSVGNPGDEFYEFTPPQSPRRVLLEKLENTAPEALALASVNQYQYQAWTPEERFRLFRAVEASGTKKSVLAEFSPRDVPEAKIGEVRAILFEAYRANAPVKIVRNIGQFKELFDALPAAEKMEIVDASIEQDPTWTFFSAASLELNEAQGIRLAELIIQRNPFDVKKGTVGNFGLDPRIVHRMFIERAPHVLFDNDLDLGPEELSLLLESAAREIPQVVAVHPNLAAGHEFSPESVAAGYAALLAKSGLENFDDFERATRTAFDAGRLTAEHLRMLPLTVIAELLARRPDAAGHIPWADALRKLEKLQARAAREEYDPWKTDLDPLVARSIENGILSPEDAESGDQLVDFVREFGAVNAPKLFEAYAQLRTAGSITELSEDPRTRIENALGKKRLEKHKTPESLLNALRQFKREMISDLLKDETPGGITSELGREIFDAAKGTSKWERNDSFETLVATWDRTRQEKPETTRVPEGYREAAFEVPRRTRAEKSPVGEEDKTKEDEKKVLENPRVLEIINLYRETIGGNETEGSRLSFDRRKGEVLAEIDAQIAKAMARLEGANERAATGMQKNIAQLKSQREGLRTLDFPEDGYGAEGVAMEMGSNEDPEPKIVALMESIVKLRLKGSAADGLLRGLSAGHLTGLGRAPLAFMDSARTLALEDAVTPKTVAVARSFAIDFMAEHYLNPNQETHEVYHTPFSGPLRETLERLWQTSGDRRKNPLAQADERLKALSGGSVSTSETTSISLVPAQGLLRVYGGDVGDACYSSKHKELAEGQAPDLHAMTFVTGRGTANERLAGSVLFVETEEPGGGKVMVVRANNPRENLIQGVDADALIKKTLDEAIETARRRGIDRVVVPLDQATASSSNRPAVAEYYRRNFTGRPPVDLVDEPETNFNGYDNWNAKGKHPVVEVWSREKDDAGTPSS